MKKLVIKSEEKRLVYGEVYSPLHVDTDGEAMSEFEIEKMAHDFLSRGLVDKIDVAHDGKESGVLIVESFLARENDPDGFIKGAWVLGAKVIPDTLWAEVKKGELNGFSFKGQATQNTQRVRVTVTRKMTGETEPSEKGLLPSHRHKLQIEFSERGRVIPGKTDFNYAHRHPVGKATATDEEMDHSHRMILYENKGGSQ